MFRSSKLLTVSWIAIFSSKSWTWLSRALIQLNSLFISNYCCLSCCSNGALFLLGCVGKSEIWSTWDACWTGVADAGEGVFTEVASGMDPVKFYLVEVAVGVCLSSCFCFVLKMSCLDFICSNKMSDSCFCLTSLHYGSAIYKFKFELRHFLMSFPGVLNCWYLTIFQVFIFFSSIPSSPCCFWKRIFSPLWTAFWIGCTATHT